MDIFPYIRTSSIRAQQLHSSDDFLAAFLQSFFLTVVCEFGDRTFFLAAIMATKSSRVSVWSGVLAAVTLITLLSAAIGRAFPFLVTDLHMTIAATLLFLFFGQQLLRDWWRMDASLGKENEEFVTADHDLKKDNGDSFMHSVPSLPPAFVKAFSLTLLAEWGDRSQVATIAIAASRNISGVVAGGIIGHGICTAVAVIGGRLLAGKISERAVTLASGIVFMSFSIFTARGLVR